MKEARKTRRKTKSRVQEADLLRPVYPASSRGCNIADVIPAGACGVGGGKEPGAAQRAARRKKAGAKTREKEEEPSSRFSSVVGRNRAESGDEPAVSLREQ